MLLVLRVIQRSPAATIPDVDACSATQKIFTHFDIAPVSRYMEKGTLARKSFRVTHPGVNVYSGTHHDFQEMFTSFQCACVYGSPSVDISFEHPFGRYFVLLNELFNFIIQLIIRFFHQGENGNCACVLFAALRLFLLHAHDEE